MSIYETSRASSEFTKAFKKYRRTEKSLTSLKTIDEKMRAIKECTKALEECKRAENALISITCKSSITQEDQAANTATDNEIEYTPLQLQLLDEMYETVTNLWHDPAHTVTVTDVEDI